MNRLLTCLVATAALFIGAATPAQTSGGVVRQPVGPADRRAEFVGTYKLVSFVATLEDGTSIDLFGTHPTGFAIITPKRFMAVLTSSDRTAGNSADARAALFNSMVAYSGGYTIEGTRLVTDVDVSWNQAWNGTRQGRTWTMDGDRLTLVTDKRPFHSRRFEDLVGPARLAAHRLALA